MTLRFARCFCVSLILIHVRQSPPLSSINIPKEEIGEQAVNLLIDRIKYPQKRLRTAIIYTCCGTWFGINN